jgi:hypothetical protein
MATGRTDHIRSREELRMFPMSRHRRRRREALGHEAVKRCYYVMHIDGAGSLFGTFSQASLQGSIINESIEGFEEGL